MKHIFSRPQFHILLTILMMAFIFLQSALPGHVSGAESNLIVRVLSGLLDAEPGQVGFVVRKGAHFAEYLVLGMCLLVNVWDCRENLRRKPGLDAGLAWALGALYAMTDEFHQLFVPGRSGELRDVCIDAAGVLCGVVVMRLMRRRKGGMDRG